MRVKFFIFLLLFVFVCPFVFFATPYNSGSGSMGKPSVKFKEWQVGRSPKGTDTNSDEQKSFITSTEEECYFTASVVYDGNQGDNVSPISKVTWSVEGPAEGGKPSHGMSLVSIDQNWSGPKHPSKLDPSTSFNVVGKLTVPPHIGTNQSHCPNYDGTNTPLNGRADTPMSFTIKFSATTEDGQTITPVKLVLLQDEKDEMRQEYMDLAGETDWKWKKIDGKYREFEDGNVLRVPPRSAFDTQNTYDDGHYSYMMGKDVLPGKHTAWTAAFKKHAKILFSNTEAPDLVEKGGYRNPHHHYYHVPNGSSSPRSWHQFGLALDVRGKDIDINKDNRKGTVTDRLEMANAAKKYAGASWTKHTYSDGHVHAQWEWEGSNKERASTPSSGQFSLPPAGTDTASLVETPNNPAPNAPNAPPAPPSSSTPPPSSSSSLQCGHSYDPNSSSAHSHRSVNFPCDNHFYYACDPATTSDIARHSSGPLPCGAHTGYPCDLVLRHLRMRPCPPDAHGNSCSIGSYYGCSPHSHSYPAMKTCDAGHSYRADHPNVEYLDTLHRTRTCRREACGRSWQPCVSGWAAANCPASSTGLPCWGTDD